MRAGVVQVDPLVLVAYNGATDASIPTATNKPAELTATAFIVAAVDEPFIAAGAVKPVKTGGGGVTLDNVKPGPMANPGPIVMGM